MRKRRRRRQLKKSLHVCGFVDTVVPNLGLNLYEYCLM